MTLFCSRRSPRAAVRARVAAALVTVAALALTACSGSGPSAGPSGGGPSASASRTPPALTIANPVRFDVPASFTVTGGRLESATVKGHVHGTPLDGHIEADGVTWVSEDLATPGASYDVSATVRPPDGDGQTLTGLLVVAAVPANSVLSYGITPLTGWTVGVNAPIVIRFRKPVEDRAAVERALSVSSSTPVTGVWHWVGSQEVHFRTEAPWPVHTKVRLVAALQGIRAGVSLFGTTDTTVDFSIGDAHLTRVDGVKHTLTVYVNGKAKSVYPTSLGRPQFQTRTGNYIVLAKQPTRRMTSCNADITCVKSDPNFYDLTVNWDVRLTYSGTFIHSAPWSVRAQGSENVSHGCVNLSPANAQAYYELSRYGDLVTVTGTARTPEDLIRAGDPGMTDWNSSWADYVEGSALGGPVTTAPLF